jgi:hypothetical protein
MSETMLINYEGSFTEHCSWVVHTPALYIVDLGPSVSAWMLITLTHDCVALLIIYTQMLEHWCQLSHSHCLPKPIQSSIFSFPVLHKGTLSRNKRKMIFTDTYIGKFQPVQQSLYFLSLLLIYSTGTVHYKSLMNLTVHAIPTEDIKGNVHSPARLIHTHSTFSVNKTH